MSGELSTRRLILRRWLESDRAPFAALNADPEVMEHFSSRLTREQSDAMIDVIEARFAEDGFGLWALQVKETGEFIGFTGIARVRFEAHFTPAVEVGWRLSRAAWGHGYATEAARAALAFGFAAGLAEIVSVTATTNLRSQAVMKRLGMTCDRADDFDHPRVPEGSHLRRHVLYRLHSDAFGAAESTAPSGS